MIYGIGTDIVSIDRINTIFSKRPERFIKKILSVLEREQFQALVNHKKIVYLAGRWAAKEALVKALGTGFREGIYLSEITITNNLAGKPSIMFSPQTEKIVKSSFQIAINSYNIHLSISHEKHHATAFVVVEV